MCEVSVTDSTMELSGTMLTDGMWRIHAPDFAHVLPACGAQCPCSRTTGTCSMVGTKLQCQMHNGRVIHHTQQGVSRFPKDSFWLSVSGRRLTAKPIVNAVDLILDCPPNIECIALCVLIMTDMVQLQLPLRTMTVTNTFLSASWCKLLMPCMISVGWVSDYWGCFQVVCLRWKRVVKRSQFNPFEKLALGPSVLLDPV